LKLSSCQPGGPDSGHDPFPNFCDAAVVRLAEMFPRVTVITTDAAHFTVYHRFRVKPLAPLILGRS
jgi:hypothetical protein